MIHLLNLIPILITIDSEILHNSHKSSAFATNTEYVSSKQRKKLTLIQIHNLH